MADKQFIREALARLLREIDQLPGAGTDSQAAFRRRSVVQAEAEHILRLALPGDSPLLTLSASANAADPGAPPGSRAQLETLKEILRAADRLNEARVEPDATAGLAQDIHRVLGRDLLKYPLVQLLLLLLAATVAFAVFGVIRFQDMKIDYRDQIRQETTEALKGIGEARSQALQSVKELNEQVQRTMAATAALDREVKEAKQRIGELSVTALKDLTTQQAASIGTAAATGISMVDATTKGAIERINAATDTQGIRRAAETAEASVKTQVAQYLEEVKSRVAPTFQETLATQVKLLGDLVDRLKAADSRVQLIDAAMKRMGTPDSGFVDRLADYFNETILAVYLVLGFAVLIFFFNVVLCFVLLRRVTRKSPAAGA